MKYVHLMETYSPSAMRQARRDAGVTLTHAAHAAGRCESTMAAYERDTTPPLPIILRLCDLFGIDLRDVLVEVEG
jgi:DNA-binding XRE family transcriptional regulator